jgi:2-polyprenyl-3-methyl-5-hydroxy-6-metoxy-1,4-benzoquinol methylase
VNDLTAAHHRLLARIHRRYRTLTEPITIGGRTYPFTRIADPNRVLDEVAAEEDRIERVSGTRKNGDYLHLPYWAELWDSALGMGELLIRRFGEGMEDETRGQGDKVTRGGNGPSSCRILDLGCGMGFPGMIAASLGCPVLFADLESPALLFAKLNSLGCYPPTRTRQLNWQNAQLGERFNLILGADILYERKQWDFLEPFWRAHLSLGGAVILGEPGRQTGDNFPAWIRSRGWKLALHEQPVATRSRPIRLFELMRD